MPATLEIIWPSILWHFIEIRFQVTSHYVFDILLECMNYLLLYGLLKWDIKPWHPADITLHIDKNNSLSHGILFVYVYLYYSMLWNIQYYATFYSLHFCVPYRAKNYFFSFYEFLDSWDVWYCSVILLYISACSFTPSAAWCYSGCKDEDFRAIVIRSQMLMLPRH